MGVAQEKEHLSVFQMLSISNIDLWITVVVNLFDLFLNMMSDCSYCSLVPKKSLTLQDSTTFAN